MAKLLIVDENSIVCSIFDKLLKKSNDFNYDIVSTYEDAKKLLIRYRYEYAVVSRTLPDAKNGEVIALLNKHNVAPIVFTVELDEEFVESFESAQIVEYILRHRFDNVEYVVQRLEQLHSNKDIKILIVHESPIYRRYLKSNLALHNFKVMDVATPQEALAKLELHVDIQLMIVDSELPTHYSMNALGLVEHIRKLGQNRLSIITIVSETNSYETSRFLNEGADDYLMRQPSRDELYVRIYQNIK
jgi:putative two-component system response regulator